MFGRTSGSSTLCRNFLLQNKMPSALCSEEPSVLPHCVGISYYRTLCSEEPSVLPHCVGISYYTKKLRRQILRAQQLFNDIQFT